jgi:1-deoxy-D-xylulose-5-phosphate reductoisomerase
MTQNITILGSTGSIGQSTLDVVARHPERFAVFALSAKDNVDLLLAQCQAFEPAYAVLMDSAKAQALVQALKKHGLRTEVLCGPEALDQVASAAAVDVVMAAIVGAAGLSSCLAAARAGKRLLLANKEALVVGARVFMDAVKAGNASLLPIDSEHSAVFQSLPEDPSTWSTRVQKIILTASGGPFRTRDPATLHSVTIEEACAHPTWVMGRKISVDSATMMNKALEVIEAHYLFGLPPEKLEVVIHPQSVIHSMVEYVDASVVAQLGTPDMRVPIAYGLSWPDRIASGAKALNFSTLSALSFESFDDRDHLRRYPGLALAWQVLQSPSGSTAVLNAANEVGVGAFLSGEIGFLHIHQLNVETLGAFAPPAAHTLDDLIAIDHEARRVAQQIIARWGSRS